jgi:cobalamin-dependent methionine synthase I
MSSKGSFIIIGENIHCTRVRLTKGKFVETLEDGTSALVFRENGKKQLLPIPKEITQGQDFSDGKVRHVAVAVHQGLRGNSEEQEAGRRYIQAMAGEQEKGGAWFIDINVDEFSVDPAEKKRAIEWIAKIVQQVISVPLSIDSSDPEILKAGLAACDPSKGKALVNSVSLERASLIPIAADAHACVIASATGATSMPQTMEERLQNINELVPTLRDAGIELDEIFLDPLVYPVSVDVANGPKVIETIRALRQAYGKEVHFAPGLSNVSHGFPRRNVINQVFAKLCHDAGCDGGIVDPGQINDAVLAGVDFSDEITRLARDVVEGKDEFGMAFISAVRGG